MYWPGIFDKLAFHIKNWISAHRLVRAARAWQADIIYTRDPSIAPFADIVEVHKLMRPHLKMIAISQGLKDALIAMGAKKESILVAHDGVDLEEFDIEAEPGKQFTAMYVGSLYPWKGVEIFKKASLKLPEINCVVASGRPHTEIPKLLKSADILVLPHLDTMESQSPLKLFEYMASQKPIIASNVPSLREVLNEHNAFFVPPGNADALAEMITYVREHPDEARAKAQAAYHDVRQYTWDRRALNILSFIQSG